MPTQRKPAPRAPPSSGRSDDLYAVPAGLPIPTDDGACSHLRGARVPDVKLMATSGRWVSLADASRRGRVVVYAYPKTGLPTKSSPPGWDAIPGARGCTPESCGFRDLHQEFVQRSARVFGLSTQSTAYQREMHARLGLPFDVLSDEALVLTRAMRLPTWTFAGEVLHKRFTLVLRDGAVEHVFYPVFPPDRHAAEVAHRLGHGHARP